MALVKIGSTSYNGREKPVYLVCGNIVRDAEAPQAENAPSKATVAAKELQDGSTLFIRLNGWRNRSRDVAQLRKMDCVLAVGPLSISEYNGKQFYDIDVDFIAVSGVRHTGAQSEAVPAGFEPVDAIDEEDGELPF